MRVHLRVKKKANMTRLSTIVGLVGLAMGAPASVARAQQVEAFAPRERTDSGPDEHWADTAAVLGLASAASVLGMAIGSEATKDSGEFVPSLFPLGVGTTLTLAVMGPVVAAGAASGRPANGTGSPGMRVAGWIAYVLSVVDAVALIVMGATDGAPVDGQILSVGVVGAAALVFFSVDAFASG